jgi:hypothetical protein
MKKILYFILFLIATELTIAENKILINDTIIPIGERYYIPVVGNMNLPNSGNIKISIIYNALNLDIKSAIGGENYGFTDNNLKIERIYHKWDSSEVKISSNGFIANFIGILFLLQIEALVGPDSITTLKPISLVVDGNKIDCEFRSAKIYTKSPIVQQKYIENLSYFYPNPFDYEATVKFTIEEQTNVEFYIYNTDGRKIATIPTNTGDYRYSIFNEKDEKIEITNDLILSKGTYKLIFSPIVTKFSAGIYYFVMKTKNGTYKTNFIYIK